jgi:hypothetical protein
VIVALSWSLAWGGAWTRELGQAYTKAEAAGYLAPRVRVPGDDEDSGGRYTALQLSAYAEAGLLSAHPLQLSVSAPLVAGWHRTEIFDVFGAVPVRASTVRAGDLRVAMQGALSRRLPVSAAIEAKVPMYANGSVGDSLPTHAQLFPLPGDGQVDVTAWLFGGAAGDGWFAEAGLGYLHRTEQFVGWDTELRAADGGRGLLKGGWGVGQGWLIGWLDGQWAWRTEIDGVDDSFTRQFLALGLSAAVPLNDDGRWALEPRLGAELATRNASQGVSAGLGLSWQVR